MLKDYLSDHEISIYRLSEKSHISYSTLNDLCNGKTDIDHCRVSLLKGIAEALELSLDQTYALCRTPSLDLHCMIANHSVNGRLLVRGKKYWLELFEDNSEKPVQSLMIDRINTWNPQWLIHQGRELMEQYAVSKIADFRRTPAPAPSEVPEDQQIFRSDLCLWNRETFQGYYYKRDRIHALRILSHDLVFEFEISPADGKEEPHQQFLFQRAFEYYCRMISGGMS